MVRSYWGALSANSVLRIYSSSGLTVRSSVHQRLLEDARLLSLPLTVMGLSESRVPTSLIPFTKAANQWNSILVRSYLGAAVRYK